MAVPIPVPTERKGSDPKARRNFEAELKAKAALSEKYKALWSALNAFIHRNGGWLVSLPYERCLRLETRQNSKLTGSNTRIEGGCFLPVSVYQFQIPLGK